MIIGFTLLALVGGSALDELAPFIDPIMVLITCVVFIPAPIGMVRTTIVELLEGEPDAAIRAPIDAAIDTVVTTYDLDTPLVRVTKIGPKVYVEVEGTAGPSVTIRQEHQVRQDLQARLDAGLPYEVWLNLELRPRPD